MNGLSTMRAAVSPNTWLVWLLMAALVAADAAGLDITGLSLAPGLMFSNVVAVAGLLALSAAYTYLRPDPRVATLAHVAAATLAFTASTMLFSYLTVKTGRPLVDDYLVAVDRSLGFDWLAVYKWVMAHPAVHVVFSIAYYSLIPQMILLLVVLNFKGMAARCWEMQWLLMLSVLGCCAFSALWPAAGAFGYFHAGDAPYVRVFMALRDGSLKVIGVDSVQGIIQFPSLHIALAMIYTYAARGIKYLFPLLLALNTLLFLATPAIGGHHLFDLWGGVVLMLAAAVLVKKMFAMGLLREASN